MNSFKKRIRAADGFYPEFLFNPIHTVNGLRYHISVLDQERFPFAFTMEKRDHSWKIVYAPRPPDWIINLENDLHNVIEELSVN